MRILIAATLLATGVLARAHDGHGPASPHWHASDLFGVALIVAVAAGLWFIRRK
jgi:hypothetical protein